MQRLIIGSTAMNQYVDCGREAKDFDVYCPDEGQSGDRFWHDSFNDWIAPGTDRFATLNELYTMKVSHSYWSLPNGSWQKHMYDILTLKNAGATLDLDLHKKLYKVWEEIHGKKIMNLDQEAKDFFSDAVKRIYEHDSIHVSVAYGERPMYERFLKPGAEVNMDMEAIKNAPFEDQLALFREEIYATALERIVIPKNYKCSPHAAYAWATKRTITSLTKGWSARFIVENYDHFINPDWNYVRRHKSRIDKLIRLENND